MDKPFYEVLDNYRAIPRLLMGLYGYVCFDAYMWVKHSPDLTEAQTNFATIIWGAAAAWFGFYVKTKRNTKGE